MQGIDLLEPEARRALDRSEHLVNDGSRDSNTDLRAIREALVAVVVELASVREMLARCYDRERP